MTNLMEDIVENVKLQAAALNTLPQVRMVAVSLGFTFAELDNGILGLCFTPRSSSGSCAHYSKAGALVEKSVLDLADLMLSANPLEKSVGVAAVNAVSRMIMDHKPDRYRPSPIDFLDLLPFDGSPLKAGMVGHIGPFIPSLVKKAESLVIVDDNPGLLTGFQHSGYTVSKDLSDLSEVDILIITGSSAAVGNIDQVLNAAVSARFIGVVGPSAGWLPDPAFRRGIHAVAAMKIIDTRRACHAILEGGGTRHFMPYAEKYTLVNPDWQWDTLGKQQ